MPNLDTLLKLIHAQGIQVGALERLRLQQILNAQPQLSGAEFRELLGTVLAKNEDERQRIAAVFERFVRNVEQRHLKQQHEAESKADEHQDNSQKSEDEKNSKNIRATPKRQTNYLPWIIAAFAITALTLLLVFLSNQHDIKKTTPTEVVKISEKTNNNEHQTDSDKQPEPEPQTNTPLIKHIPIWSIDKLTLTQRSTAQEFIPRFMLFLGSAIGFLWLLVKIIKRTQRRLPKAINYRLEAGYHTPPVRRGFYKLLNARDRQTLSWGVGHYLAQDQQQRIDIEQSVNASASQGFPVVVFEQQRREREVWIWQDRLNQSPMHIQMIREIKQLLAQANIHVKHGFFNGTPQQISDRHQQLQYQVMGALPQPVPLVLLCLDASQVNAHFRRSPSEAARIFQHLKQWSTLAVVDVNPAVPGLKQTLKDYRIPYLRATQVADWFASQGAGALRGNICKLDDVYRWACACALVQRIVTEDEAYALHDALGLNCAWQYSHLKTYGKAIQQGLDFSTNAIKQINDLSEADRIRAIQFWRLRLQQIDQDLTHDKHYPDWHDSHSRYTNIKIPRALLGLWDESLPSVVNKLQDYAGNDSSDSLNRIVRRHLAQYTCQGLPGTNADTEQYIQLPHEWQSLEPQLKQQLCTLGLAGYEKQLTLRPDTVSALLMAGLAGLSCYALYQCAAVLTDKPVVVQTRLDSPTPPKLIQSRQGDKHYLGTAQHALYDIDKLLQKNQSADAALQENQRIEVSWSRKIVAAQESITSESDPTKTAQLWRAATRRYSPARDGRIVASHAIIKAAPENASAQSLARLLLDSGSADQVLISSTPMAFQKHFSEWIRFPDAEDAQVQRIIIGGGQQGGNPSGIPNVLTYNGEINALFKQFAQADAGVKSPEQLQDLGFTVTGRPFLRAPITPGRPILLDHGMKLMPIPAGSFAMGSDKGDKDEKPVHTVTIAQPFWMSETEVTFAQYAAYGQATGKALPDDEGRGRRQHPVINVSWQDAVGYTQWLSDNNARGLRCRLPSEAEWEYAARAGTTTAYYWGDDGGEVVREYANTWGTGWHNKWAEETAPVKQFKPNGFGLYDMSGNVWEWTQDQWHEDYAGAPMDGSAWEAGDSSAHVLRGGSWVNSSDRVRSASRNHGGDGNLDIGFRVVCSPIER